MKHEPLGNILVEKNLVSHEDIEKCLKKQKIMKKPLGEILIGEGLITEEQLTRSLAQQLGFTFVNLQQVPVSEEALNTIPADIAKHYQVLPLSIRNDVLTVAISDPLDLTIVDDLTLLTGHIIEVVVATKQNIEWGINRYYLPQIEEMPFFIRNVRFPVMSKKELNKAIHYNTKLNIPLDPEELTLRYSLYKTVETENGEVENEYIVFAVRTAYIEKIIQTLNAAGLHIDAIGIEPEAIFKGLQERERITDKKETFMIVRTDTKWLLLAIYNNQKLVYSRYVPYSNDSSDWEQEIRRTIVSWNGKNKENRIKEVLLLGDANRWGKFKESIEEFLPLRIQIIESPYTACLGIALKHAEDNNFYIRKHLIDSGSSNYIKLFVATGLIGVIGIGYLLSKPIFLEKEIKQLENQLSQPYEVLHLASQEQMLMSEIMELRTLRDEIEKEHIDILDLRKLINSYKPENIQLQSIVFSKESITIDGVGNTHEDVITFFKGLQKEERFPYVVLTNSLQASENVQFTIEILENLQLEYEGNEDDNSAETE